MVLPTYNYGSYIGRALSSLQRQTHNAWECLVVDDGSADETADVVSSIAVADPRIRYLRQENRGMSAARNAGLAAAKGRYVQFLDADDALQPRKLETHAAYLEAHPECDVVYGPWGYWDGNECLAATPHEEETTISGSGRQVIEPLLRGNMIAINAPLVRSAAAQQMGPFDESLSALEDWEYWLRFALRGCEYARVTGSATIALVSVHATSVSQDSVRMLTGLVDVRRTVQHELTDPWQRQLNRQLLADSEAWLGTHLGVHGSLIAGMRTVLRASMRHRKPAYLVRAALLPFAATAAGKAIGARIWPRLFTPGHARNAVAQSEGRVPKGDRST